MKQNNKHMLLQSLREDIIQKTMNIISNNLVKYSKQENCLKLTSKKQTP